MDIIFIFGENYYETGESSFWLQFILTVLGAFLGFGSALFFYYKKMRSEKKEELTRQKIISQNKLKYHRLLIENLIKTTNNQIKSINEYVTEQKKDLLNIIPPKQIATNDFKRLVNINNEIFESLNTLNKDNTDWLEDLKKLHVTTDYIESVFSEIFRITTNHLKECYKKASDIKQKIELISDRLSSFAFYLRKQLEEKRWENDLYVFVNDAIKQYRVQIEAKADFHKINKDYLEPLLKRIVDNYQTEPFFEEIMFLSKNARVKMNDIETDVDNMISEMNQVKIELEKSVKRIEESIEKINDVL